MGDYMGNMQFRYAEEKDAALILEFIKDLAEYENMQDDVVATEELLTEWIFKKEISGVGEITGVLRRLMKL